MRRELRHEERAHVETENSKMDIMMKYKLECCSLSVILEMYSAHRKGVRGVLSFDGQRPSLLRLAPRPLIATLAASLLQPLSTSQGGYGTSHQHSAPIGQGQQIRKSGRDGNNHQMCIRRELTSLHRVLPSG